MNLKLLLGEASFDLGVGSGGSFDLEESVFDKDVVPEDVDDKGDLDEDDFFEFGVDEFDNGGSGGGVEGFNGTLEEGFTLGELEDYVRKNKNGIESNIVSLGDVNNLFEVDDYVDLAILLNCDPLVLKDSDLNFITDFIISVLNENVVEDSKKDYELYDMLWALRSAGVSYESRSSLGVSEEEYKEYIKGLIEDNNLEELVGLEDSGVRNSVVKGREGKGVYDSLSPRTKLADLVEQDVQLAKDEDWSDNEVNSYLMDVVNGFVTPFFLQDIDGATDGSGEVLKDSDVVKSFLNYNKDYIENSLEKIGFESEGLYDDFLRVYEDLFRELFYER